MKSRDTYGAITHLPKKQDHFWLTAHRITSKVLHFLYQNSISSVAYENLCFREFDNYSSRTYAQGYHINTNTIEKFRDLNKNELITNYGEELLNAMKNGEALEDPSKLAFFIVLTFCVSFTI